MVPGHPNTMLHTWKSRCIRLHARMLLLCLHTPSPLPPPLLTPDIGATATHLIFLAHSLAAKAPIKSSCTTA
ncbi:hypothetical protein PR202_gb04965 [Eleusine coracana subsp. coracana]|uniref:Uncharacterized protein n=1 Tax=Eleusine coracana subsp. coracana TaxID=191504 RepID=A0AAV5E608_ELECO|nr:hypothetical protein PR202_gb04965 [Eleusine coracana subsp. coracana]